MSSALQKVGGREDGEAIFDCPFRPVEKGFVPMARCDFFFLFLCSSDLGSSNLPNLPCSIGAGEYVNK